MINQVQIPPTLTAGEMAAVANGIAEPTGKKGPRRPPFTHERFPERHGSSITAISQSPFVLLPLLLPFGCVVSLESAHAANPTPPSCRFPEVELVFHFKLNELALHYCVEMLPAWIRCRREVRYSDRLIF